MGERTEGERTHRLRRGDPFQVIAVCRAQDLVNQPGLSNTCSPRHQHTGPIRVSDGVGNETLFLGSPDDRPSVHGLSLTDLTDPTANFSISY